MSYYLVMCVCCVYVCSIGLNSSNNKVVYQLTLLQYIRTLLLYVYFLFAAHDDWLGLAMLQASISISEACFYVGILI